LVVFYSISETTAVHSVHCAKVAHFIHSTRGRPNMQITASSEGECAAECRNAKKTKPNILPKV